MLFVCALALAPPARALGLRLEDERRLAFDTAKAFIRALGADGVLRSAQRELDAAKSNLETSQARAQSGLANTDEVTNAELQLATSLGQLANAQSKVRRAHIALSFLVGQRIEGPLVPPRFVPDPGAPWPPASS